MCPVPASLHCRLVQASLQCRLIRAPSLHCRLIRASRRAAVEVRVDGGPWRSATLARPISADTWCQYSATLPLGPGTHSVQSRAIDADGGSQSGASADPAPDGAEGLHTVTFTVT